MGRDKIKIAQLDLDTAYGIRKLCNGNLKYYYDTYIRGDINLEEFYAAMRTMNDITPHVDQVIEESYAEALADNGLDHDTIALIPTLQKLFVDLERDLQFALEPSFKLEDFIEKHYRYIKFYNKAIEKGLIEFEKNKKSKLI